MVPVYGAENGRNAVGARTVALVVGILEQSEIAGRRLVASRTSIDYETIIFDGAIAQVELSIAFRRREIIKIELSVG